MSSTTMRDGAAQTKRQPCIAVSSSFEGRNPSAVASTRKGEGGA
jgi:hypothetical protein